MRENLPQNSELVSEEQHLLTRQLIAREEIAFQHIFEKEKKRCFTIARGMLGHTEEAADTVQEAFLKLWKSSSQLDEKKGYRAWLYRCVINATLDRLRQKRRHSQMLSEFANRPLFENKREIVSSSGASYSENYLFELASSNHLSEELLQKEQNEILKTTIQKALLQLDEKYRMVVLLRIWEKMPYKEIAELLNIPPGTAGRRFSVGLGKLEQILSHHYQLLNRESPS
ncbi:MAG: sigma-70 family RNA polymerase sigma factor [Planctomycetota bacterium]